MVAGILVLCSCTPSVVAYKNASRRLTLSIPAMYSKVFLRPHCEPSGPAALPLFQPQQVQGGRRDGYWIEAFPFETSTTRCPNIIAYGLGTYDFASDIEMFVNPYANTDDG